MSSLCSSVVVKLLGTFATQLVRSRVDIRTVQELMGHDSVETTMIYTHALNRPGISVESPLDDLTRGDGMSDPS